MGKLGYDSELTNNMQGNILKYIRVANDYSQDKLAKKFGITKSHLSNIETGRRKANDEMLNKYCDEFDLTMNELKFFDETANKKKLHKQQILLVILKFFCDKKYPNENL